MSYTLFITSEVQESESEETESLSTVTSKSLKAELIKILSVSMKTHRLSVCHNIIEMTQYYFLIRKLIIV